MDLQTFAASYWMADPAVHANQVPIESSMQKCRQHNGLSTEPESEKGALSYINLNTNRSGIWSAAGETDVWAQTDKK